MRVTELERCTKCNWSILIDLSNGAKRCLHCGHEWRLTQPLQSFPMLFKSEK